MLAYEEARRMLTSRAASTLALCCALVLRASVASAQVPATNSPSAPVLSQSPDIPTSGPPDILRLMSEGHELYDAGRYKDAAASFERAMQLGVERPHEAALHVARSYAKLGNAKQAQRWMEIAELLACAGHDGERDAARPLPASTGARTLDALISRLEEAPWRTRPAPTPIGKCPSSGSSTISTT